MKCRRDAEMKAVCVMVLLAVAGVSADPPAPTNVIRETIRVQLPAGAAGADVYWRRGAVQAPLVIIAHGFSRHRHNMAGWGRHLAGEGYVAVVPDLPTQSDHCRVAGALHVDAECPTSWLAELVCGRSTEERRAEFQVRVTKALKEAFADSGAPSVMPSSAVTAWPTTDRPTSSPLTPPENRSAFIRRAARGAL